MSKAFLGIKLDPEDKALLKETARKHRITVSDLVRLLLFEPQVIKTRDD